MKLRACNLVEPEERYIRCARILDLGVPARRLRSKFLCILVSVRFRYVLISNTTVR